MKRPLLLNIFSKLYRNVSIFTWCEWREATFPVLLAGIGEQWTSADLIGLLNLRTKKWHLKTVNSVERRNRMWNKIYIFSVYIFCPPNILVIILTLHNILMGTTYGRYEDCRKGSSSQSRGNKRNEMVCKHQRIKWEIIIRFVEGQKW